VEEGVAGVEDSAAFGRDDPGDLRIAKAIDRRQRRNLERPGLERLPGVEHLRRQSALRERGFGSLDEGGFLTRAGSRHRPQDRAAADEHTRKGGDVGVVAVHVCEQRDVDGGGRR
jgi:hypothetical protein